MQLASGNDTRPRCQSQVGKSCLLPRPRLRESMARLSFIVAAAAAAGCAAFTAPARTPMALSTPVHISSRGALNRAPHAMDATPARRRGCAVSHRSSPKWLMCAQVHAATDEYQSRPLRRPGCLCGTEPAAQLHAALPAAVGDGDGGAANDAFLVQP